MKQLLFNILTLILISGLYYLYLTEDREKFSSPSRVDEIKLEQPEFLLSENPTEDLMKVLKYYDVKHKKIVMAQAILETGYFRSRICLEYNNLFGLYNSSTGDYYRFNHWSESVVAYIRYVQYKYKPPNDYYEFLEKIGYAEDPEYLIKIKKIVYKIENDQRRDSTAGC